MCETENDQIILFSEISGSQSVRLTIIIFWEVLSVTPLTKKKTIHVIKALLIFQYGNGSEDSYRRHIVIRKDPGDEVERFLESEPSLDSKTKPDMPDTMQRIRFVQRNRTLKLCYIFSSNNTCNLDVVGKILSCLKEKLGVKMLAFKNHFSLSDTTEMCESIIPDLPMDFAIFVVHANEDRFLIDEDSARIYRALWKATGKF